MNERRIGEGDVRRVHRNKKSFPCKKIIIKKMLSLVKCFADFTDFSFSFIVQCFDLAPPAPGADVIAGLPDNFRILALGCIICSKTGPF